MLIPADFDLNSAQKYADATKEVLKQTILNQEIIFRKQVYELHRLYAVQKTLMENLSWRELESYDSWKACTQSKPVDSTRFINQDLLEGHQGVCSQLQAGPSILQKRPFDLQLPADQYISCIGIDLPEKGKNYDSLKESLGDESSLLGDNGFDPDLLKLSLSIGEDISKKGCGGRNRYSEKTYSSPKHVIDLEESDEETQPVCPLGFAGLTPPSGDKQELQSSVLSYLAISKSGKKDPEDGTMTSCSVFDGSKTYQGRTYFHQGLNESYDDVRSNNLFTEKQHIISYAAGQMDLNRIQFEDSSSYSNDDVVPHPSTARSTGIVHGLDGQFQEGACPNMTCWEKPNADCLDENSDSLPTLVNSNYRSNNAETLPRSAKSSGSELCPIDLESVSGPAFDLCKDPGRCSSNTKNEVDLPLELPSGRSVDDDDTVFLFSYQSQGTDLDGNSNKCLSSCKSDCITDNNSSSIKTMLSGVELGDSNLSTSDELPKSQIGSQVTETPLSEQDSSESKHQCISKKAEESDVNALIQKAAESLICISLEGSACYQDCFTNKKKFSERENGKREQPQYSSDSFESITLKLTASSADDYCVSSMPFEVNGTEEKDFGFKLRRGRRMKDFQRDILPGLATLTRHEICEDINIMDGVIRSREYRKMRSKMGNGDNWCTPLRSRRSRRNNGGRRNHL